MPKCREDFVDTPFEAAENEFEESVTEIVADVLDVDRVGRTDSFYDFAGTSLQAIRICAKIQSRFGIKARPLWLFEHDTAHDFVAQLRTGSDQAHA